jgi:type III pantothenate kinase
VKLLIDIGNTRFKYSLCSSPTSIHLKEIDSVFSGIKNYTNEYLTSTWLGTNFKQVNEVVFANVSDDRYTRLITSWAKQKGISVTLVTTSKEYYGVINSYDNFQQLGVDRWLGLIGAKHLYKDKTCLIIDSGTATTFDLLGACGKHYGGWILPGIDMMASSVVNSTAQVSGSLTDIAELDFGCNTSQNLTHASWAGTIGAVHQALIVVKRKNIELDFIVFTGGNGMKLLEHSGFLKEHCELTFSDKLLFAGMAQYIS